MNTIQNRILQYLELKGITPYRFCKDLGISMGYLDKKGAIGTDKYLKIIEYYSDLDPEWLLTGKGEMLRDTVENMGMVNDFQEIYGIDEKIIEALKNEISYKDIIIAGLERENKLLWKLLDVDDINSGKARIG